jgi:2-phosphoglycerate kinase
VINKQLSFELPKPWDQKRFETSQVGAINFLVGPNGSGKSKFAGALRSNLDNARILGTDRLSGMEQENLLSPFHGNLFETGLAKNSFSHFKAVGQQGSGLDTFVLLEERLDLLSESFPFRN